MAGKPKFVGGSEAYVIPRSALKFELGAHGERFLSGTEEKSKTPVCATHNNTRKTVVMVEVFFFGKVHIVTEQAYIENAAKYHKLLGSESLILLDAISSSEKIYNEWARPTGWVDGAVALTVNWFTEVSKGPKPDPVRFETLWEDAGNIQQKLGAKDLGYETIREIGISLTHIRSNLDALNREVNHYRNEAIDEAATITRGLETVESASFQVLGVVPTLLMMDPLREAAYKIGLVLTRLTARGVGAWLAESDISREVCGVLKQDVPPLLSDLIVGAVGRYATAIRVAPIGKEFSLWLIQQQVEFTCDLVLLVHDKGSKISSDDLAQLGINRLTSSIAKMLSLLFGGSHTDPAKMKWAKALIESTCNTVYQDLKAAYDQAKQEKPPASMWEVFLKELPWTIVKILQGTVIGAFHRNAATAADFQQQTGLARPGDARESASYLQSQSASSIFSGKYKWPKDPPKGRPARALPTITPAEAGKLATALKLNEEAVANLRRYAHDQELLIVFRLPNKSMAKLIGKPGCWPKPMAIKAKTCEPPEGKSHEHDGRVINPYKNPPTRSTPAKQKEAEAIWNQEAAHMKAEGCMVRGDGLLFHPDMIVEHGNKTDNAALAQKAKQLLSQAKDWDLSHPENQKLLEQHPDVKGFVNGALIGYHGDVDFAEIVDARTAERRILGSYNETSDYEIKINRINQDNLDRSFNINKDMESLPGVRPSPHPLSLTQHGGDWEFIRDKKGNPHLPEGGEVGVIGPDGFVKTIESELPLAATKDQHNENIRQQWENLLKARFQTEYKDRSIRGQQLRKSQILDWNHWQEASGQGKIIRTNRIESWTRYYNQNRHDAQGHGVSVGQEELAINSIHFNDVLASLIHRALFPVWPDGDPGHERLATLQAKHGVVIAHNQGGDNFVLATVATQTIGDALVRLAHAAKDSGLLGKGDATLWYELYTPFRPVTTDGILNRLGGKNPGIKQSDKDLKDELTSENGSKTKKLYAFSTQGFTDTFKPTKKEHQENLMRLGFEKQAAEAADDYGKTQGLRLVDIWEELPARELKFDPTLIKGRSVVVFTAGLATCPADCDLRGFDREMRPMLLS